MELEPEDDYRRFATQGEPQQVSVAEMGSRAGKG